MHSSSALTFRTDRARRLLPNWRWTGSSLEPEYENPLAKKDGMHTVEVKGAVPVPSALVLALLPHILCTHHHLPIRRRRDTDDLRRYRA